MKIQVLVEWPDFVYIDGSKIRLTDCDYDLLIRIGQEWTKGLIAHRDEMRQGAPKPKTKKARKKKERIA